MFQKLFPLLPMDEFIVDGRYGFGRPKSLGTVTPVELDMNHSLHSNWGTHDCVRLNVGEFRVHEFITFHGKSDSNDL